MGMIHIRTTYMYGVYDSAYVYWKNAFFGDEPPKHLWKDELYRAYFANAEMDGE